MKGTGYSRIKLSLNVGPTKVVGEDIVHATSNRWKNMNKVSLAEAGDGSPPFWRFDFTGGFLNPAYGGKVATVESIDHLCHAQSVGSLRVLL